MTRISGASDASSSPSSKLGKARSKQRVKREREHRPPPDVDSLEGMEAEGIGIGDVKAPNVMIIDRVDIATLLNRNTGDERTNINIGERTNTLPHLEKMSSIPKKLK